MIRYVDSGGWTWEVCESAARDLSVPADVVPSAGRAPLADAVVADDMGELYFFSRLGTRKLRSYPESWFSLPRTELEALCDTAQAV